MFKIVGFSIVVTIASTPLSAHAADVSSCSQFITMDEGMLEMNAAYKYSYWGSMTENNFTSRKNESEGQAYFNAFGATYKDSVTAFKSYQNQFDASLRAKIDNKLYLRGQSQGSVAAVLKCLERDQPFNATLSAATGIGKVVAIKVRNGGSGSSMMTYSVSNGEPNEEIKELPANSDQTLSFVLEPTEEHVLIFNATEKNTGATYSSTVVIPKHVEVISDLVKIEHKKVGFCKAGGNGSISNNFDPLGAYFRASYGHYFPYEPVMTKKETIRHWPHLGKDPKWSIESKNDELGRAIYYSVVPSDCKGSNPHSQAGAYFTWEVVEVGSFYREAQSISAP